jgi:AcrR family transcriptional regulator
MARGDDPAPLGRGDRTRERLLDVAVQRFADRGYRETSLAGIAREAGVSPPLVNFHFKDKESVFRAAFDREATALFAEALGNSRSPQFQDLIGIFPRLLDGLERHPLIQRILQGTEPGLLGPLAEIGIYGRMIAAFAAGLRSGQRDGVVRGDLDVDKAATALEALTTAALITTAQTDSALVDQRRDAMQYFIAMAILTPGRGSLPDSG